MKRLTIPVILVFSLLFLGQVTFAQTPSNWTILHYTAVDNNVESPALYDFYKMQSVGSGRGVNIVAEFDRSQEYDRRFGDWADTRRFYIQHVDAPPEPDMEGIRAAIVDFFVQQGAGQAEAIRAQVDAAPDSTMTQLYNNVVSVGFEQTPVENLGEVDMGDPQSLRDFIVWGVQNYPADHYMIIIADHGGGWRGIGPDEGNGKSMLDLPEISTALADARSILGIDKFDIVGFDACLMGVLDVAVALAPHTQYVLSSEEVIPGNGWEYADSITAMQDNPDWDAFQVGANFIDNYMSYYAGPGARTKVGLSLIDTAQLPALLDSLQNFTQTIGANTVELLSALGTARSNSQVFGTSLGDHADSYSYIDLRDFMNWFSLQTSITEDAYNAAQEVIAAYDSAVAYSQADAKLPGANGLAIYLPATPVIYSATGQSYPADAPSDLAFWQEYLNQFYTTITDNLDGSALQINITNVFTLGETGSIIDNPVVSFDASGLGVIDMAYTITYLLDDSTRVVVDTFPIAYTTILPTGEQVIEYPNELTPSQFVWGAEVPMLSDGVTSVLGLAQSSGGGSNEAYIQGTYVSAEGAKPAYLVFDNSDLSYSGMLTIADESPSAVIPNPGDQFIVDIFSISEGNVTVIPLADSPLTFGIQPFMLSYQPAQPGTYEIGLSMTDLAGNKIYKKTTLDVDNSQLSGDVRGSTDINNGVYFQYPREWGDSNTIANDDGSVTYTVGSKASDQTIFVDVYPDTDTAAALAATMETYPAQYGSITETTLAQMPALAVDFTFESDSGTVSGVLISILNAENGSAVVFALQTTGEDPTTLTNLIDLLNQSIILFMPLDA